MCNCIQAINTALEVTNTMLDIPMMISLKTGQSKAPRMMIATCKRDSKRREKPMCMPASYCPCCGEKYKDNEQ